MQASAEPELTAQIFLAMLGQNRSPLTRFGQCTQFAVHNSSVAALSVAKHETAAWRAKKFFFNRSRAPFFPREVAHALPTSEANLGTSLSPKVHREARQTKGAGLITEFDTCINEGILIRRL